MDETFGAASAMVLTLAGGTRRWARKAAVVEGVVASTAVRNTLASLQHQARCAGKALIHRRAETVCAASEASGIAYLSTGVSHRQYGRVDAIGNASIIYKAISTRTRRTCDITRAGNTVKEARLA